MVAILLRSGVIRPRLGRPVYFIGTNPKLAKTL
jgi:hypothetical protein